MYTIALDTSSNTAAVAVAHDDAILLSTQLNSGYTHSEQLLPLVDHALKALRLTMRDIGLVAVTIGPGSFTGLRIGIATAKGLAQGVGCDLVGVPTLEALAQSGRGTGKVVVPMLNARRQEVYTAIFKDTVDGLQRLSNDQAMPLAALMRELNDASHVYFCGDGVDAFQHTLVEHFGTQASFAAGTSRYITGEHVARCALKQYRQHGADPLYQMEPLYLRRSEAVINWENAHPGSSIDD